MRYRLLLCCLVSVVATTVVAQVPPTRDPRTPGYPPARELADATLPPATADGNFILGPTHAPAPEASIQPGVPQGRLVEFTMESTDSKLYPGIARDPGTFGTPDPTDPAKLNVTTSHPAPYHRKVTVYVPAQNVASCATFTTPPEKPIFAVALSEDRRTVMS